MTYLGDRGEGGYPSKATKTDNPRGSFPRPPSTNHSRLKQTGEDMKKKLRIGILFGGRSGEHEVSLLSAASILKAIDKRKYNVVPIGISKSGHWLRDAAATALLNGEPATLSLTASSADLTLAQATPAAMRVDVVFPVL